MKQETKRCDNCYFCRQYKGEIMGVCRRTMSGVYIHSLACRFWEEIVTIF